MKHLCTFSRFLLGVVFIVSGLTKVIDPVGTGFVITEYLNALGLNFFSSFSVSIGALQSMFELVLGVALIVGLQLRLSAILTALIMVFFLFFTLWIAIFNPVQHCGCFGDAIRLSNWETFLKNVIFTPFSIILLLKRKHYPPISLKIGEWSVIKILSLASLLFSLYCYRHLPDIEFTGYKVGNSIPEAMTVPEDAPKRQYETTFIYQKGSETKKFSFENLPDSTWSYVSSKTKLIHPGVIPEIPNLDVSNHQGRYITDSLLSIKGSLLVFTIPYTDKAWAKAFEKAGALYQQLDKNHNISFIVISGSGEQMTSETLQPYGLNTPRYFSDPKTIYTMVRSNPGLMLWYDAHVVAKWSAYDIPSYPELKQILDQDWELFSTESKMMGRLKAQIFCLSLLLLIAGLCWVFRRSAKYSKSIVTYKEL